MSKRSSVSPKCKRQLCIFQAASDYKKRVLENLNLYL